MSSGPLQHGSQPVGGLALERRHDSGVGVGGEVDRGVAQAKTNSLENFRWVFDNRFLGTIVSRMDDNEAIYKRILDDEEFRKTLLDLYASRVYLRARL